MAVDTWMLDSSGGVPAYTATEARLGTISPLVFGGGATALTSRSGVLAKGLGTELLTQAQGTPNMTVKVNPGQAVIQALSATGGAYAYSLDAVSNVTITAADASLARKDRIGVRIRDNGTNADAVLVAVAGTPSGSPALPAFPSDGFTYFDLAEVAVAASATSISAGNITDKRLFTVSHGGRLPCLSTARPSNPYPGMEIYETDTAAALYWNGSAWRYTVAAGGRNSLGLVAGGRINLVTGTLFNRTDATYADVTGLSVTWTSILSRIYRVDLRAWWSAGTGHLLIADGSSVQLDADVNGLSSFTLKTSIVWTTVVGTGGSMTVKGRAQGASGANRTITADATHPASILVQDIGI